MTELSEKQARRFQFLHRLYEVSKSQSSPYIDGEKIAQDIGVTIDVANRICDYLAGERLLRFVAGNGLLIELLHDGVKEVEAALANPDQGTFHFPPGTIIVNSGTMITQTIQGNQNVVSLSNSLSITALGSYIELLEALRKEIASITTEVETQTLFHRRIDEALAELRKPTPDVPVIRSLVGGIKTLLTFAGGAIAEGWLQKLLGLN